MENPLIELKQIAANQKTVSTNKLAPIIQAVEKMYIQQGQKINGQKNKLNEANSTIQKLSHKLEKKRDMVQQLENLKLHHRNLTREYNLLLEKIKS